MQLHFIYHPSNQERKILGYYRKNCDSVHNVVPKELELFKTQLFGKHNNTKIPNFFITISEVRCKMIQAL